MLLKEHRSPFEQFLVKVKHRVPGWLCVASQQHVEESPMMNNCFSRVLNRELKV